MAVSKQPNITPETSSGEGLDEEPTSRGEAKWKRFHPLRVVRKIFRKRHKRELTPVSDTSKKSWSTSELQSVQDDAPTKCESAPLKIGLSVSHDSIFSSENNVRGMSSEYLNAPHCSSLSVHPTNMKTMFQDELFSRVRARRDSNEEDDGLPESFSPSPTSADTLSENFKGKSSKSLATCSAGSLISMEGSENDEDSAGNSSAHSSKMSLFDRKSLDSDGDNETWQPSPLNHSAAKHKMAIRPKRNHGLPRGRVNQVMAARFTTLPSTPEVIEENGKVCLNRTSTALIKTVNEYSVLLNETSSLVQSSESNASHFSSSSYNEMSKQCQVFISTESISEMSSQLLKNTEVHCDKEERERNDNEAFVIKDQSSLKLFEDINMEFKTNDSHTVPLNLKMPDPELSTMKNIEVLKNSPYSSELTEYATSQIVSSNAFKLVQNVENSDVFKMAEKSQKHAESLLYSSQHLTPAANNKKNLDNDEQLIKVQTIPKSIGPLNVECKDAKFKSQFSRDLISLKMKSSSSNPDELNVNDEFILKTLKQDNSRDESVLSLTESLHRDQKHPQYSTEDSIMSNKLLSKKGADGGIYVSNVCFKDDFADVLVTEAHNFVGVDESAKVFLQVSDCNNKELSTDPSISWISSEDTAPKKSYNRITVNTPYTYSESCDTSSEETIQFSVNSNSASNMISSIGESSGCSDMSEFQSNIETSKPINISRLSCEEKLPQKILSKSHSPDRHSFISNIKEETTPKRLSVEIMPFNQRNMERKYQYTSAVSKDTDNKKTSVTIERKLSDRKVSLNEKNSDKTVSRNSFSGLHKKSENDKKCERENQSSVQFRIRKNSSSDVKVKELPTKIISSPANLSENKDNKHRVNDNVELKSEEKFNSPNWEIKIQPLASNSKIVSEKTDKDNFAAAKLENMKSSCTDQLHLTPEAAMLKNNDNRKLPKEVVSSTSDDPKPELLQVFARRSIKQKHCDKKKEETSVKSSCDTPCENLVVQQNSEDSSETSTSKVSKVSAVKKTSETAKLPSIKHDLKKKSKSFTEKEKAPPKCASPLKEINLIRPEATPKFISDAAPKDVAHSKPKLNNISDGSKKISQCIVKRSQIELNVDVSETSNERETIQKSSIGTPCGTLNGSMLNSGMVKENQDIITGKELDAPSWVQLAQQRRELREQRERLLLGGSSNAFLDATNKPSRSSKVWDMVNNFQKLQMT